MFSVATRKLCAALLLSTVAVTFVGGASHGGEELYDLETDPHEWTNLARDRRNHEILAEHRRWLPAREAVPAPDFIAAAAAAAR